MDRSVVVVPVERATDAARLVRVAAAIAPPPVDVHLVEVTRADGLRPPEQARRGPAVWPPGGEAPARDGAVVRHVRLRGRAEAIIPAYAQLVGARIVVVERDYGTPGIWRSAAVVRRLSRSSPVPVLVWPAEGPARDRVARGDLSRVVVAVDSSMGSAVALSTGVALARRHDARLTMLQAIEHAPAHMIFSGSEAWRVMQRLPAEERQAAVQLRRQAARLGDTNAGAQVVTGHPGTAIVTAAAEADADLVVMGVAPRTTLDRWVLGSTLDTVLRRTRTPVLVVSVVGGAEPWDENTFAEEASRAPGDDAVTARTAA